MMVEAITLRTIRYGRTLVSKGSYPGGVTTLEYSITKDLIKEK